MRGGQDMNGQEFKEAKLPTLDEMLGINSENSKDIYKELKSEFGVRGFIESHRQSMELLNEIEAELEKFLISYEKNKEDREPVEKAYALEINILLSMARRFHPLSDYGKEMLSRAVERRKEFESEAGPMITGITSDNINLFRTVLSSDIAEDVISGKVHAIGALRTSKQTVYGVGALVYHVDALPFGAYEVLRADWLFVNKKFRERGIAHHLLGELIAQMAEKGLTDMSAEIPADIPDKQLLSYIFGSWHFVQDVQISPDTVIRAGDIDSKRIKHALKNKAVSLERFDDATRNMIIKKALRQFAYAGYLWGIPNDYADAKLSFYMSEGSEIKAMLLAHRMPSGIIRVECPGTAPKGEKYLPDLIYTFLERVMAAESEDTVIAISADGEETGEIINDVCPVQLGQYVISGTLSAPSGDINLDRKAIEKLLNATA